MTNFSTKSQSFIAFSEQFSGDIILPNDHEYDAARTTYAVKDAKPAIIVRPVDNDDVAAAVLFASNNSQLKLSIRSGGHSSAGFSTNNDGLVIDLSRLNSIEVLDRATGLVRLGAGALWGDVAARLDEYQLAISSGDTVSVGVGGLTLGGGIGWMVRKYGYAIDNLVAAKVVLADGTVVRASPVENSELFWGLRGGGGNFGIVTSFDFQAHHQSHVVSSTVTYGVDGLAAKIIAWRDYMRFAPEELTSFMTLLPSFGPNPPAVMIVSCYAGDDELAASTIIDPLRKLGDPKSDLTVTKPYSEMLVEAHPPAGVQITTKDMFMKVLDNDIIATLAEICCKPGSPIVQLRMLNGAINKIDPQATAMAHRNNEAFLFAGFPVALNATDEQIAQSLGSWNKLAVNSSGVYGNFISTNSESDIAGMYPAATYEHLAKIKLRYDPENIFSHNFNIAPAKA